MKSVLVLQTGQKMDKTFDIGLLQAFIKTSTVFFRHDESREIISRVNDAVKLELLSMMFLFRFCKHFYHCLVFVCFNVYPLLETGINYGFGYPFLSVGLFLSRINSTKSRKKTDGKCRIGGVIW